MKKNIYQTGIGISLEFDSINTKIGFSLPEPSWLIMSVSVKSARSITFCDKKQPTVLSIIRTAWCHFVIVVKRNHTGGSQVVRWPLIPRILATENCLPTLQIASVGAREHVLVVLQSWPLRHCYHRPTLRDVLVAILRPVRHCHHRPALELWGCWFLSADYKKCVINQAWVRPPCPTWPLCGAVAVFTL